jgi:hypothetical protein
VLTKSIADSSARFAEVWAMTYSGGKKSCECNDDDFARGERKDSGDSQPKSNLGVRSVHEAPDDIRKSETREKGNSGSDLKNGWLRLQEDLCGDFFSSRAADARNLTKDWFGDFLRPAYENPFAKMFPLLNGWRTDHREAPDVFGLWSNWWEKTFQTLYMPYRIQSAWADCVEKSLKAQIRSIEALEQLQEWNFDLSKRSFEIVAKKLHGYDLSDSGAQALGLISRFWITTFENALSEQLKAQALATEARESSYGNLWFSFPFSGFNESRNRKDLESTMNLLEVIISRLDELENQIEHVRSATGDGNLPGVIIDADDIV